MSLNGQNLLYLYSSCLLWMKILERLNFMKPEVENLCVDGNASFAVIHSYSMVFGKETSNQTCNALLYVYMYI